MGGWGCFKGRVRTRLPLHSQHHRATAGLNGLPHHTVHLVVCAPRGRSHAPQRALGAARMHHNAHTLVEVRWGTTPAPVLLCVLCLRLCLCVRLCMGYLKRHCPTPTPPSPLSAPVRLKHAGQQDGQESSFTWESYACMAQQQSRRRGGGAEARTAVRHASRSAEGVPHAVNPATKPLQHSTRTHGTTGHRSAAPLPPSNTGAHPRAHARTQTPT